MNQASEDLRARLMERRDALKLRLQQLNQTVRAGLEADSEEQAVQIANDEVRDRLLSEAEQELNQVQRALERMASGTYGVCEGCGLSIDGRRLLAYPMAALCIRCAEQSS